MKACRVCGRLFSDEALFCQADGQELSRVSETPVQGDSTDNLVGRLLCDRYLIFRVVADGGMGRVYEGLDKQEGRHVALKILHPEVAGDSVSVERFKREYEVSRSLPHEHIVEVTDFQPIDDSYVLVMEFLVGEELRAVLKREKVLPPERVVRMVSQIAIGLDEAHARQFIHRDLKPDNVFLCQTQNGDIAKLLDFGSVKDRKRGAKQLTVLGTTIGSPYYMSPEQAQALDTLDQRADVWALTAVVYECITGTVPFKGNNGPSILMEILRAQPTAPSIVASAGKYPVPPGVDRVIAQGLQKSAASRTGSIGELADNLGRAYGLTGDHLQWARINESELGEAMRRQLPHLMSGEAADAGSDAIGEFFGDMSVLGEQSVDQERVTQEPAISAPTSVVESDRGIGSHGPTANIPLNPTPRWVYVALLGLVLSVLTLWLLM